MHLFLFDYSEKQKANKNNMISNAFPNQRAQVYSTLNIQHPQICAVPATESEDPGIHLPCGANKDPAFSVSVVQYTPLRSLPWLITGQCSPVSDGHLLAGFWPPSSQKLGGLPFEKEFRRKKENETNLCKCM